MMWHQRTKNMTLYAEFIYEGYYFKGLFWENHTTKELQVQYVYI
jgi:hypothetical protein